MWVVKMIVLHAGFALCVPDGRNRVLEKEHTCCHNITFLFYLKEIKLRVAGHPLLIGWSC